MSNLVGLSSAGEGSHVARLTDERGGGRTRRTEGRRLKEELGGMRLGKDKESGVHFP